MIPAEVTAAGGIADAGRLFLLFTGLALIACGMIIGAGAYFALSRMPEGRRPSGPGKAAVLALGGLSLISLLAGVLALLMFFLTPVMAKGLLSG